MTEYTVSTSEWNVRIMSTHRHMQKSELLGDVHVICFALHPPPHRYRGVLNPPHNVARRRIRRKLGVPLDEIILLIKDGIQIRESFIT